MALIHRIQNLEVTHAAALHACRTCGGSDPNNPGLALTSHDRPFAQCPECGLDLDDEGRPLPPIYKRIILSDPDAV